MKKGMCFTLKLSGMMVVAIFLSQFVCGQQMRQGIIKGIVMDSKGFPIESATIFVKENQLSTQTDNKGNFFMRVFLEKQTIGVTYIGYKMYQSSINIESHNPVFLKILMPIVWQIHLQI